VFHVVARVAVTGAAVFHDVARVEVTDVSPLGTASCGRRRNGWTGKPRPNRAIGYSSIQAPTRTDGVPTGAVTRMPLKVLTGK
jgi:hypothetical protein